MATLISKATGNFTSPSTWWVCDTTAELDSEAGTTALTTGNLDSAVFTPGAITINGIAIKVATRAAGSPSNTIRICLYNNTLGAEVAATVVTFNVADIDPSGPSWYRVQFADVLLLAANDYKVRVSLSSTSTAVSLYTNGTANNWTRELTTSTAAAPGSGDKLFVIGEQTGAGTGNNFTVTMDNTATTSFGPTVSGGPPQGIAIGKGGTWTNGSSASTAYYFKWKGVFCVCAGGALNIGTVATPIPSTSTAIYEMDSAANVDTGFKFSAGSTVVIQGASKATLQTLMTADKSAAATVISGLTSTSGWANGDELVFPTTTQTAGQTEKKTISTVDSSTQVTLTAGLTNAHSGTSPTQCNVGNLTRNVRIRGISTSLQGYIVVESTASVDVDYAEFYQLGSGTSSKRGIDVQTTTGSCSFNACAMHDFIVASSLGFNISGSSSNNITLTNSVFYAIANNAFLIAATSGTAITIDGNLFAPKTTDLNATAVLLNDIGFGSFTNNEIVSGAVGLRFGETGIATATFTNVNIHGNSQSGFDFANAISGGLFTNFISWRNTGVGMNSTASSTHLKGLTFDNLILFGNGTNNILTSVNWADITFLGGSANGDTTFATTNGFNANFSTLILQNVRFFSFLFGSASGIKTTHTNDINISSGNISALVFLNNCLLASGTEVSGQTNLVVGSGIFSTKHDQTAGNHKSWFPTGTIQSDATLYNTAAPSMRVTPNNASTKIDSGGSVFGRGKCYAVASGQTCTPTVQVRKSAAGDGAAYNGNQPRLIVKRNDAAGITSDTVLATYSASTGSWNALSGTTAAVTDDAVLEFLVDCDGTDGWVNVDDWA